MSVLDGLSKTSKNKNSLDFVGDNKIAVKNIDDKPKKKIIFYHFYILRIISSFAVVLIHVSADYYYKSKINCFDFKISFFYNGIARFGVPIFYMISGALFLNQDISFNKMYNKYIKRMLIHLIIWSFIYSISNVKLSKNNIKKIILKFFSSHYHLWFLFSIIGIYMLVPFLRLIAKKDELLKIYILLSIIFNFVFPNFIIFLSYYSKQYSSLLQSKYNSLNFNYRTGHVFYFMIGHYLNNKNEIKLFKVIFIYITGLLGVYFTTVLSYNFALKNKKKMNFFSFDYLNIATYSISIFISIKALFNNNNYKKVFLIKIISANTFGIYLIHPLIKETIKKYEIFKVMKYNKLLFKIPMATLFIYISSLLISIIIRYIPLIGQYLF